MEQLDLRTRLVVENTETGERYTQATSAEWAAMLDAWKRDLARRDAMLAKVEARARKRGTWGLYRMAKRGAYGRILPCPMPWDHIMFERDGAPYKRIR